MTIYKAFFSFLFSFFLLY